MTATMEPVRMRTTVAAGPDEKGGARIFVRAYPPVQTTADIQIWTKDRCDVIPQAERVAASVGQIYAFVNYSVQEQFLGGNAVPTYEGEFAGYPIYNGWVVMTKDRRLPWIPQTLGDRLTREEDRRQRELDDWNKMKAARKTPDEATSMKAYETLKKLDQAQVEANKNKNAAAAAELRERSTALAVRVREIRKAHIDNAFFPIQDARAEYELTNLTPGAKEDATAFKPDPAFPDFKDPFRPQVIIVKFWSKSDPNDNSPRTVWLRTAKETFDFAAVAALLR